TPVNEISSDRDFSEEVPYWRFSYVYSNRELDNATKAQKEFYKYFKNKFLEGEYVDIKGNSNYAFILYFDLIEAYQEHKDIQLLERQFKLLGEISSATKRYMLNSLKFKLSKSWIQVANATLLNNNFSILSMGVSKLYLFLGLLFNFASISSISLSDILEKSVPFGKYCLINPFKFSLAPRCQDEYG